MAEQKKDWTQEAIEREATPRELRKEKTVEFCKNNNIFPIQYYRFINKKENKDQIRKLVEDKAIRKLPDVVNKMIYYAEKGNSRMIEIYLNYIAKYSKNYDHKSDGQPIYLPSVIIDKNGLSQSPKADSNQQQKIPSS